MTGGLAASLQQAGSDYAKRNGGDFKVSAWSKSTHTVVTFDYSIAEPMYRR